MNNKEFIALLHTKTGYDTEVVQAMVRTAVKELTNALTSGEGVSMSGLGSFEVRKRMERIISNPATGQKMLVPPKLVINFKPFATLKEKVKEAKPL